MRSYDPPPATDDLTPEQSQAALNAMHAASMSDREHPFFNGNHPQHRDFNEYSTRLHTIIATAEAEEKDTLAAQVFADAHVETGDLTPAECLVRGRELLKTPGYLSGALSQEECNQLAKQIDALYLIGCQEPETSTSEEEEISDDL